MSGQVTHSPSGLRALPAFLGLVVAAVGVAGAGPLDPPSGPVSPTGRTLTQIEPRTMIQTLAGDADSVHRIAAAGSYYLTASVLGATGKAGIEIAADNVVLDLSGFAVSGVTGSLAGISVSGARTNITIRNGTIRNFAGTAGISAGTATSCRFEGLLLSGNAGSGLTCGEGAIVSGCSAEANGSAGFNLARDAVISDCTANGNTGMGFTSSGGCTFTACVAVSNLIAGFAVNGSSPDTDASTFRACVARLNSQEGFRIGTATTMTACAATNNGLDGVNASFSGSVSACAAADNTGKGFNIPAAIARACAAFSNTDAGMSAAMADGCAAFQNQREGILADSAHACAARGNTFTGILVSGGGTVSGCVSTLNGASPGVNGIFASDALVSNCVAAKNTGNGIRLGTEASVTACVSGDNGYSGIEAGDRCAILTNLLAMNDDDGILVATGSTRVENNHVITLTSGITILGSGTGSLVVGNSINKVGEYSIAPGNLAGFIVGTPVNANPWDNFEW